MGRTRNRVLFEGAGAQLERTRMTNSRIERCTASAGVVQSVGLFSGVFLKIYLPSIHSTHLVHLSWRWERRKVSSYPKMSLFVWLGDLLLRFISLLWPASWPTTNQYQQSVVISSNDDKGRDSSLIGDVRASLMWDLPSELALNGISTLYDAFLNAVELYGNRRYLGKPNIAKGIYTWQSYAQVHQRALHIGSGLLNLTDVQPIPEEKVASASGENYIAIFSRNCPDWVIVEQACYDYSLAVVGLYDTCGTDSLVDIINDSKVTVVVCGDRPQELCDALKVCPSIKTVVRMGILDDDVSWPASVKVLTLAEIEIEGSQNTHTAIRPQAHTVATLCYTSGTTGKPKGVVLTHGNIISTMDGMLKMCVLTKKDVHLSYLPLVHMMERVLVRTASYCGMGIGFYRGDIQHLFEDLALLKPTIFVSVPRLFNRLHAKTEGGIMQRGGLTEVLFYSAIKSKRRHYKTLARLRSELYKKENRKLSTVVWYTFNVLRHLCISSMWNVLVLQRLRNRLGGRVRLLLSGAAPISHHVMEFLGLAFSCQVATGYGSSETCIAGSCTYPTHCPTASCGPPTPNCQMKIIRIDDEELPDMEESHGEVCIRGPSVFLQYYNNPEATSQVLDEEGWYHTGDIGSWTQDGTLVLHGRKRDIFKLSQGEYVSPGEIEAVFMESTYVEECFVYGDSLKSQLVAIVFPNEGALMDYASRHELTGSFEDVCKTEEVVQFVLKELQQLSQSANLKGFKQVKAIHLLSAPFDEECFTPTRKIKRHILSRTYHSTLTALYKQLGAE